MEETSENKGYGKKPFWMWIIIYLIAAVVLYGAFYYLFLGKKGGYNSTSSTPTYTTPKSTPTPAVAAMQNEMTVKLVAENNSGESGTAVLKEDSGKTTVTLDLIGYVKDASQPAHIHIGVCPGVGVVKYPLTNVVNGKSVTVLPVTLSMLKAGLPLAINVHKSKTEIIVYTSCGELSAK